MERTGVTTRSQKRKRQPDEKCATATKTKRSSTSVAVSCACSSDKLPVSPVSVTLHSISEPKGRTKKAIRPEISNYLKPRPKLLFSFNCGNEIVSNIAPVSIERAWISVGGGYEYTIQLRDTTGTTITEIDVRASAREFCCTANPGNPVKIKDLAIDPEGNLFVSCCAGAISCIMKVTKELQIKPFVKEPNCFYTSGFAVNQTTGELFVCRILENNPPVYGLSVLSADGELIQGRRLDSTSDTVNQMFHNVACNGNGCVCVSSMSGNVVILDRDGNIRATHKPRSNQSIILQDVCCDNSNRIIVADYFKKCIHMLSEGGQFQMLLTESDGLKNAPSAVAVDQIGHLWVGDKLGNISIYSYV